MRISFLLPKIFHLSDLQRGKIFRFVDFFLFNIFARLPENLKDLILEGFFYD
jgi:hypothetical protein